MKIIKIINCRHCPYLGTLIPVTEDGIRLETVAYCKKKERAIGLWAYEKDFVEIPDWCPIPNE